MYMAGRLRTASMPPNTLMDFASYLWPGATLAAVTSRSPIAFASLKFALLGRKGRPQAERVDPLIPMVFAAKNLWRRAAGFLLHPVRHWRTRRSLPVPVGLFRFLRSPPALARAGNTWRR